MKASKLLGALLLVGLCLPGVGIGTDAYAQGKKNKKAAAAPVEAPAPQKPIVMTPEKLAWGMNHKQVAEVYDAVIDEDYKPLFKKVSPGVKMKALEAQQAEDKSTIRRSRIDFGNLPTTLDSTPLKGEFTYKNQESILVVERKGTRRYLFFIQNKLWKFIDEIKLSTNSPFGADFQAAVGKLATDLGVVGRVTPADYDKGRNYLEVDWKDGSTHLRAIQRSDDAIALAYEDNATVAALESLRPVKPPSGDDIDPDVAAAVRGGKEPPKK